MGSGKITDWQEVHAFPAGDSNLVFLQDSLSGRDFSLMLEPPFQFFHGFFHFPSAPLSKTKLLTFSGSPLPCFGAHVIPLPFGSRHFSWSFQFAPVSVSILGSDFLRHHALLVGVATARVLDADFWMSSPSFLLQLPLIHSVHICSRLPEKSGKS